MAIANNSLTQFFLYSKCNGSPEKEEKLMALSSSAMSREFIKSSDLRDLFMNSSSNIVGYETVYWDIRLCI